VGREADLVRIVAANDPARRGAHLLDGRQQQADEDGDNGDDDQQFDQRKPLPLPHGRSPGRDPSPFPRKGSCGPKSGANSLSIVTRKPGERKGAVAQAARREHGHRP